MTTLHETTDGWFVSSHSFVKTQVLFVPGMSLSGPFLLEISVKSLRILAAFPASDFRLDGMGLLTVNRQIKAYLNIISFKSCSHELWNK